MLSAVDRQILAFLDAQRQRALEIVDGLDEAQLRTPALPSGWTIIGMIQHLCGAERHWVQGVARGFEDPSPFAEAPYDPTAPFVTDEPTALVIGHYRELATGGDAILASLDWDAPPAGAHGVNDASVRDIRTIVLHLIEETARHLGHLDAARELLDGSTRLGQDDL